jgi:dihydroorotate dehydrogenase
LTDGPACRPIALALPIYSRALGPLLFLLSPAAAHALAFAALGPVEHVRSLRGLVRAAMVPPRDERLVVRVLGMEFGTPLGLAAGFDKNALRPRALAALGFGHLELGTVTARPQGPNPRPNLFRLRADRALVNRLGFPNEGADRVAERLRDVRADVPIPLGLSIGKSRDVPASDLDAVVADYLASFEAVCGAADFVVVNVSSPNTPGLRQMQQGEQARALLGAISRRAVGRVPVLLKVAPDLDAAQAEDLLAVVEEAGLAGVVATNTTIARDGLATGARRLEAVGAGGLSGPPLRARALELVRRARARLGRSVVVIGVGGVERAEHVMALVRAGADLVQMYTGFVYEGPGAPGRIARELVALVEREGARSISDLIGVAP